MSDKPKHRHAGHRERVKQEFLARGAEGWPDHRVVELLLFYAIPQGDVNGLAHDLVERFGSLAGVLDASVDELKKVSDEAKIPLMVNLNEKGFVGGQVPIEQVKALNYSIGLFPISSMLAAAQGMIEVLGALANQGSTLGVRDKMTDPPTKIHRMMGQFSLVEKYAPYYDK